MRHILSYIPLPIVQHGCHGNPLFIWYHRLKSEILSYLTIFKVCSPKLDHIWGVKAKYVNFSTIISHNDVIRF